MVKANKDSEAGVMPEEKLFAEMAAYHGELQKAGVLLDGQRAAAELEGLAGQIWRQERSIIDGPFAETKELIAGYTIIQVKSREEAVEWSRRFPNPTIDGSDCEIEVRQMYELEDFPQNETIERFREMEIGGA
jgi:hypothetical protein